MPNTIEGPNISRREFLKNSARATVSVAAASILPSSLAVESAELPKGNYILVTFHSQGSSGLQVVVPRLFMNDKNVNDPITFKEWQLNYNPMDKESSVDKLYFTPSNTNLEEGKGVTWHTKDNYAELSVNGVKTGPDIPIWVENKDTSIPSFYKKLEPTKEDN